MSAAARELVSLSGWLACKVGDWPRNREVLRVLAEKLISGESLIDVDSIYKAAGVW